MSLDKLQVVKVPAAFAKVARQHNALVKLLAQMVGKNGLKVITTPENIVITTDPTATLSANELHYLDENWQIDIDGNGIYLQDLASGNEMFLTDEFVLRNNATGDLLTISADSVARNMEIRTIDVCDSGTPASMDIIASAPY